MLRTVVSWILILGGLTAVVGALYIWNEVVGWLVGGLIVFLLGMAIYGDRKYERHMGRLDETAKKLALDLGVPVEFVEEGKLPDADNTNTTNTPSADAPRQTQTA